MFQELCLKYPEGDWNTLLSVEETKELAKWITNTKDLRKLRIARCSKRNKYEDPSLEEKHPYFQHASECQEKRFGSKSLLS